MLKCHAGHSSLAFVLPSSYKFAPLTNFPQAVMPLQGLLDGPTWPQVEQDPKVVEASSLCAAHLGVDDTDELKLRTKKHASSSLYLPANHSALVCHIASSGCAFSLHRDAGSLMNANPLVPESQLALREEHRVYSELVRCYDLVALMLRW